MQIRIRTYHREQGCYWTINHEQFVGYQFESLDTNPIRLNCDTLLIFVFNWITEEPNREVQCWGEHTISRMKGLEKVLLRTEMERAYCDSVLNTGIVFFSVKFWVRRVNGIESATKSQPTWRRKPYFNLTEIPRSSEQGKQLENIENKITMLLT